ncbi:MAG TPA: LysM domain-containing protein [Pyrinomonadaceae bacterium]|nr:LysM domain-containing protein [Pyrinomonadaceae bacterium]
MPTKKSAASKGRKKAASKRTGGKKAGATATRTRVQSQQEYRATSGDTLKSVADKFKVPLKFLARANNLSEGAPLTPGVALLIPALKFDVFGGAKEGWVQIAPIWYQKGTGIGDDRIIVPRIPKTLGPLIKGR